MSASRPVPAPRRVSPAAERFGWTDVLASISDGVVVLDADGFVSDINPAAELLTGTSASHAVAKLAREVFGSRSTNAWLVDLVLITLQSLATHRRSEEALWDGTRDVIVSAACAPIVDAGGILRGAVLVLHDLTLQRTIETASRHAERLASLGTVAVGLAHEIRNPLGGIKGAAQLLRTGLTDPEQIRCTDLIVREVERLAGLVDQLRDLGSPPPLVLEAVNVHRVLNAVFDLVQQAAEWKGVALVAEFDPSLPAVLGDRAQLFQVFLNLLKNAAEAVDGSGAVTVATRMDTGYRVRRGPGTAQYLAITITDDGPGVPEADQPRLFAPFFTTKARGTGLGLAICQRILTQHGGALVHESPSRGGARFRVTLPVSDSNDDTD